MKKVVKIVIDPKDTRKMCSDKKKFTDGCITCFSEVQESVNTFLAGIEAKDNKQRELTEEKDARQRARMSDEWAMFLKDAKETLSDVVKHTEKEASERNTNSKWILTIVLGVTFCLGAAVGIIYKEVAQKADRKEVVTLEEMKMMHELTQAYNSDQFLRNPYAKVDTTNFNWLVKKIFSGTMRGGTK